MSDKPTVTEFRDIHKDDFDEGIAALEAIDKKTAQEIVSMANHLIAQGQKRKDVNEMMGACIAVLISQRL